MKIKTIFKTTIICLLILIIIQAFILRRQTKEFVSMPIFLPPSLKFESQVTPKDDFERHPSGITVDDIARGLFALDGEDRLALNEMQIKMILPIVKELAEKRWRYLQLRNLRHTLNEKYVDLCIEIVHQLSQKQFNYILSNRDLAEWELDQKEKWKSLEGALTR